MTDNSATILVVDDLNTSALEKLLRVDGYHVLAANDGLEALDMLQKHTVDLVILDIVMPNMDGYETLRRIRAQYGDSISVLLASASYTESVYVAHGLQIGADDYVFKPFDFLELKARIETKLLQQKLKNELRQARAEAEAQNDLLRRVLMIVQDATRSATSENESEIVEEALQQAICQRIQEGLGVEQIAIWRLDANDSPVGFPPGAKALSPTQWRSLQAGESMVRDGERVLIPMHITNRLVGALEMTWVEGWGSGSDTILKVLADSLAIVFQNANFVRQIKRENQFHNLLNELASRDASLPEVLSALSDFTGSDLLLVNRWFHLLVDQMIPQFVQEEQIRPFVVDYYRSHSVLERIERGRTAVEVEPHGIIPPHHIFPVILGGEVMALIITLQRQNRTISIHTLEKEVERIARFLAGVLHRHREADLRAQQVRADFLSDFLAGDLADISRADLFLRANAFGLNLTQPSLIARIELPGFEEQEDWSQPLFEEYIANHLTPLLRDAKAAREGLQVGGLEVRLGKHIVTILSLPAGTTEEKAQQIGQRWAESVLDSYNHRNRQAKYKPAIGMGRLTSSWRDLPRSADEAARTLRWVLSNTQTHYSYYGDLGSERLLAAITDREELIRFHDEQLHPLITYDNDRDGELVRTLEYFFANGGQLSRTAQRLYIHANTLKYRLDQINDLTKRDPRNPDAALDFQLALKIHRML